MSANRVSAGSRLASLELANKVRTLRKELKEQLRCRHINIVSVLMDPPACCESAAIGDVLRWAPAVGSTRAEKVLRSIRMSASVQLGRIPDSRRRQLVNELVGCTPALQRELAS